MSCVAARGGFIGATPPDAPSPAFVCGRSQTGGRRRMVHGVQWVRKRLDGDPPRCSGTASTHPRLRDCGASNFPPGLASPAFTRDGQRHARRPLRTSRSRQLEHTVNDPHQGALGVICITFLFLGPIGQRAANQDVKEKTESCIRRRTDNANEYRKGHRQPP